MRIQIYAATCNYVHIHYYNAYHAHMHTFTNIFGFQTSGSSCDLICKCIYNHICNAFTGLCPHGRQDVTMRTIVLWKPYPVTYRVQGRVRLYNYTLWSNGYWTIGSEHFVALVDRPQIVSRSMGRLIHIMTTRKPIPTTNCTIQEIREIMNFWCRNKTFLWECLRSYDVGNASITDQIV